MPSNINKSATIRLNPFGPDGSTNIDGLLLYNSAICSVCSDGQLDTDIASPDVPTYLFLVFEVNDTVYRIITDADTGYLYVVKPVDYSKHSSWVLQDMSLGSARAVRSYSINTNWYGGTINPGHSPSKQAVMKAVTLCRQAINKQFGG